MVNTNRGKNSGAGPGRLGGFLAQVGRDVATLAFRPDAPCRAFALSALGGDPVLKLDVIKACALLSAESDGFVTDTAAYTNDHDHS